MSRYGPWALVTGASEGIGQSVAHALAQRGVNLILFGSIVAFQGVARSAHYAATKACVQTLAEGLGREWQALGVDALAVTPRWGRIRIMGAVMGGMTRHLGH